MDESSMSYKQFAELTGISESGLKNWLYRKKSPNAASVLIIAEAFDVSCDWLLGLSNERKVRDGR